MKTNLPPALAIERKWTDHIVPLCDCSPLRAFRHSHTNDAAHANRPDYILLSEEAGHASTTMRLTPAMVVHIANTLLTDNERAAITQSPLSVALDASVREDLITADDKSAILASIAGGPNQ